jgi:hypothetical protein
MRSKEAIRKCAEWLAYCLSIGFDKASLKELESLWWKYHDNKGNLKKLK